MFGDIESVFFVRGSVTHFFIIERGMRLMDLETFKYIVFEDTGDWFSEAELNQMIDEELAKDPSEMDTDFVDLCLDALDGKFDNDEEPPAEYFNKD